MTEREIATTIYYLILNFFFIQFFFVRFHFDRNCGCEKRKLHGFSLLIAIDTKHTFTKMLNCDLFEVFVPEHRTFFFSFFWNKNILQLKIICVAAKATAAAPTALPCMNARFGVV